LVSQDYPATPLGDVKSSNDDQSRGIDIVRRALESPLGQIAENADHDGAAVAGSSARGADVVP
jgi:chaperonin GroEL